VTRGSTARTELLREGLRPGNVLDTAPKLVGGHHKIEIDNATIAELLAAAAEQANDTLKRAYKRAARAAFLWPSEARDLVRRRQPLTDLPGIGPYLEKQIQA
jgi:hypothetical protein